MKYLNASQAAKRIGIADKTIRRWLDSGKISGAIKRESGQYAIPESEVEEMRKLRLQLQDSYELQELVTKVAELEQKNAELEEKIATLMNKGADVVITHGDGALSAIEMKSTKRVSMPIKPIPPDLPTGTIDFANFAERHGIARSTFKHHIDVGIAGEQVDAVKRPKPGRPDHTERYLTPEQQTATLDFWKRHGVQYEVPAEEQSENPAT